MLILACRHGDTFEPGQTAVWVGSRNDLPLTPRGIEQAHNVAKALEASGLRQAAVFCGPLKRTRDYAAIITERLKLPPPRIDAALGEIDYGAWSGLDSEQVAGRFGKASLDAWEQHSIFPPEGMWSESEQSVRARVDGFLAGLQRQPDQRPVVAVTSNGVLRVLAKHNLGTAAITGTSSKVKTGNSCILEMKPSALHALEWNVGAQQLAEMIRKHAPA